MGFFSVIWMTSDLVVLKVIIHSFAQDFTLDKSFCKVLQSSGVSISLYSKQLSANKLQEDVIKSGRSFI